MIQAMDVKTIKPPVIEKDGYTNVVLALRHPGIYMDDLDSSDYIPCWEVVNTYWYNRNSYAYLGWIELEHITPPELIKRFQ